MYLKLLLTALAITAIVIQQVFSLSCMDCYSLNSWEDCNNIAKKENCSKIFGTRETSCLKAERYTSSKEGQSTWEYYKRCHETRKCNQKFCQTPKDDEDAKNKAIGCNLYCCKDKDYCNTASKQGSSVVMVTILYFSNILFY